MHSRRITKRLVDSLKPSGPDSFVWDDSLFGFGLRVQRTGAKSYVVKYRAGSGRGAPTRRLTLGRVGTLTPDEARALARKTLGAVAHGSDPAALKAAERRASTLRELADIFLTEHVEAKRKPATATHYRSLLEKVVLPELGSRKAEQVTPLRSSQASRQDAGPALSSKPDAGGCREPVFVRGQAQDFVTGAQPCPRH